MAKKKKSNAGRPSEMIPATIKKLEEAFALDASINEACFYAGISKTTYYNRLDKKPELVDRFEALRNNPVLLARKSVIDWIKEDPKLALQYLERKRKWEFSTRTESSVEQSNTITILTEEQQEALDSLQEQKALDNQ